MSSRPSSRFVRFQASRTCSCWVTSTCCDQASPPAERTSSATCIKPASFRSTNMTRAPSLAKRRALARPKPEAAPVMMAALPASLIAATLALLDHEVVEHQQVETALEEGVQG